MFWITGSKYQLFGSVLNHLILVKFPAGVSAEVQLQPLNAAVLRGSKALFNCSTTLTPSVMIWTVNGLLVVTITEASGVLNSTDRFSATNFTTPGNYKWELIISNVQRNDAGEVTCQVLGGESRMATLSVQGELLWIISPDPCHYDTP